MRTAAKETAAITACLNDEIAEAARLQLEIEEREERLKLVRATIRDRLEQAGLQRYATPAGEEALLIERTTLRWNVDRLEDVLTTDEFEALCPRKADGDRLRKLMESDAVRAKALRACVKTSTSVALEVRAAPRSE